MKLLLDENLSPRLVAAIQDIYPGSMHLEDYGLLHAFDSDVWALALKKGFAIVTKDSDFSELSVLEGHPPKVIWLRVDNRSSHRVLEILRTHSPRIEAFGKSSYESCLILSLRPRKDGLNRDI